MKKENLIKEYVEGLKAELEYKKIVRIDDLEDEGLNRGELFKELNKQGIEFKEPFEIYINEYGQSKTVPDDCIYCEAFYINDDIEI